jgi:hypothetical protein
MRNESEPGLSVNKTRSIGVTLIVLGVAFLVGGIIWDIYDGPSWLHVFTWVGGAIFSYGVVSLIYARRSATADASPRVYRQLTDRSLTASILWAEGRPSSRRSQSRRSRRKSRLHCLGPLHALREAVRHTDRVVGRALDRRHEAVGLLGCRSKNAPLWNSGTAVGVLAVAPSSVTSDHDSAARGSYPL